MRRWTRLTATAIAVATLVIGVRYGSKVAGGSDSYGYVSQADLFLSRQLSISQPWVEAVPWPNLTWSFTPLAYRPGPGRWLVTPPVPHEARDRWAIVPTTAPGLPLLMAGAKRIAGHCAIFWVVPICGALLVLATYGLGERMGSPVAGLIAAWLVATSPTTQRMVLEPMSDVPAAAAWAVALRCLFGRSVSAGACAGLAAGLAITIRPNLVPLAIVPVCWQIAAIVRARGARGRAAWAAAATLSGIAAGIVVIAAIQWAYYGSPWRSGYGALDQLFDPANVGPNLRAYTSWFAGVHTPVALAGVAALLVPARRLWRGLVDRGMVVAGALFVAGLVTIYLPYSVFDSESYLRFLLPAWPFVMLGLAHVLLLPIGMVRWGSAVQRSIAIGVVAAAALILGLRGIQAAADDRRTLQEKEARYVTVATRLREISGDNAIVLAIQHSGSVRYYAGRMTLAFEALPPAWLDKAIAWMIERGMHPYAVLEDWEIRNLRSRYAGQASLALFDTPIVQHALVFVFDLKPDPSAPVRTEVIDAADVSCRPPAPPPAVAWR
ncbi:MAG TPA: hypothetical protein VES67_19860 [Vicinamibacterales bacterium]|nr:hypothetical protein [Vicinamibacterales bacterium]